MASHLIFGAGLIGGFMAGSFATTGETVMVFGRERLRDRFANGLKLTDYRGKENSAPPLAFFSNVSQIDLPGAIDVLWLTVKCTDLKATLDEIKPLISEQTILISCQNGLGSHELVSAAYPENRVLRAIMQSNVAEPDITHLHRGSQGTLVIEDFSFNNQSLAARLNTEVLPTQSMSDVDAFSWSKLQLNLGNAINALADIPVREMLGQRCYRQIIALAMRELLAVTDNKGISLPKVAAVPMHWIPRVLDLPNWVFEIVGRSMLKVDPTVRTSMWWDLRQSRKTEIDYLNGAVVEQAHSLGLPSPVNQKICEWIRKIEASNEAELPRPQFDAEKFLSQFNRSSN